MNAFITGTDTGIGKTVVTAALLQTLRARGRRAVGMKPVAAGVDAQGENEDVAALMQASSPGVPRPILNPYLMRAPTAPHLAAEEEGRVLEWSVLDAAYRKAAELADIVLVEGVGGWCIPLSPELMLDELPRRWDLPVILVAGIRLGALNHTLLTVDAIRASGCRLLGFIANEVDPTYVWGSRTVDTLEKRIDGPCLARVPWCTGSNRIPIIESLTRAALALDDVVTCQTGNK